jgi:hypothetical protein
MGRWAAAGGRWSIAGAAGSGRALSRRSCARSAGGPRCWRAATAPGGVIVVGAVSTIRSSPFRVIRLDGYTGTAKTAAAPIASRGLGAQVIDLEGLARHRGSILGDVEGEQPAQKAFEIGAGRGALGCARSRSARLLVEAEIFADRHACACPPRSGSRCATPPRIVIEAPVSGPVPRRGIRGPRGGCARADGAAERAPRALRARDGGQLARDAGRGAADGALRSAGHAALRPRLRAAPPGRRRGGRGAGGDGSCRRRRGPGRRGRSCRISGEAGGRICRQIRAGNAGISGAARRASPPSPLAFAPAFGSPSPGRER